MPALPGALLVMLTLSAEPSPEVPGRTVPAGELATKTSFDMDAARAWKRPAEVSFRPDAAATRKGTVVTLGGWLLNTSSAPQQVVVFPVAAWGFFLQPTPGHANRLPPPPGAPPRPMPAPPPPQWLTLPAQSRVRLSAVVDLSEYAWVKDQPQELEWSFQFWDEPKPHGTVPVPAEPKTP